MERRIAAGDKCKTFRPQDKFWNFVSNDNIIIVQKESRDRNRGKHATRTVNGNEGMSYATPAEAKMYGTKGWRKKRGGYFKEKANKNKTQGKKL